MKAIRYLTICAVTLILFTSVFTANLYALWFAPFAIAIWLVLDGPAFVEDVRRFHRRIHSDRRITQQLRRQLRSRHA